MQSQMTPPKPDVPQPLTDMDLLNQVHSLSEVVDRQRDLISRLTEQLGLTLNQSPHHQSPPPSSLPPFVVKPRDIPELTLEELEGMEAGGKLAMFIDRVEQVTPHAEARLQVAKTRLSSPLALLIQNQQNKGVCKTWATLKHFLMTEFTSEMTVDRAWQEIDAILYDWETSPHAFSHQLLCKYALLETNFPLEKFPDKDQTIKRKICHGLPPQTRSKLEAFLEETYPLKKFIERVEYERQFLLEGPACDLLHVRNKSNPPKPKANPKNSPQKTHNEPAPQPVNPLMWEVKELSKKVDDLVRQRNRRRWCDNCQKNTHATQDCWGRPRTRQ